MTDKNELPDGTLSKSTAKRVTALAAASVSERARECPACKGAGEVMQPVWTPDPQDGYDALGTCPRCGGNGSTFPQALQDLLYFTEHCLSAADEGVDYSTSREWLDAMTTMGVMKKTGRGKWAPSDQAQPVADALRAIEQALTQQRGERFADDIRAFGACFMLDGQRVDPERIFYTTPQPSADAVRELQDEVDRLNAIVNTPQSNDFLRAVSTEAEHQRQRWGSDHDAGKAPADWFWLVGYLAGKALHAHAAGDTAKAEHHIITTAAALANWHLS